MTIIDPPWGIGKGAWDTPAELEKWSAMAIGQLLTRVKESVPEEGQQAVVLIFGPPKLFYTNFLYACDQNGFPHPEVMLWVKDEKPFDNRQLGALRDFENILITYYCADQKPLEIYTGFKSLTPVFFHSTPKKIRDGGEIINRFVSVDKLITSLCL